MCTDTRSRGEWATKVEQKKEEVRRATIVIRKFVNFRKEKQKPREAWGIKPLSTRWRTAIHDVQSSLILTNTSSRATLLDKPRLLLLHEQDSTKGGCSDFELLREAAPRSLRERGFFDEITRPLLADPLRDICLDRILQGLGATNRNPNSVTSSRVVPTVQLPEMADGVDQRLLDQVKTSEKELLGRVQKSEKDLSSEAIDRLKLQVCLKELREAQQKWVRKIEKEHTNLVQECQRDIREGLKTAHLYDAAFATMTKLEKDGEEEYESMAEQLNNALLKGQDGGGGVGLRRKQQIHDLAGLYMEAVVTRPLATTAMKELQETLDKLWPPPLSRPCLGDEPPLKKMRCAVRRCLG